MSDYQPFLLAKPVWPDGKETEIHYTIGLYTVIEASGGEVTVRIATSGVYRLFVNGSFVFWGPARCAHDFFRVDEIPLSLPCGEAHIAIECVNYYTNSFEIIRQKGFLTAEVAEGDRVLAATGTAHGFDVMELGERIRRIQRYSYQRPAAEAYRLTEDYADWRIGRPGSNTSPLSCVTVGEKTYAERRIPLHTFPTVPVERVCARGTVICGVKREKEWSDRSLIRIDNSGDRGIGGCPQSELEWHLSREAGEMQNTSCTKLDLPAAQSTVLEDGQFEILSMPSAKTGFFCADICCTGAGSLYLFHDEILSENGDVDPLRTECCNVMRLDMEKGSYRLQSITPISFRYMKLIAVSGAFSISSIGVKELICPQPVTAVYRSTDPVLRTIFDAARETFLQNSSDLFMDCPTRERAGWLCDSFFTARAEWTLTGTNVIETNFLENYLLPPRFADMPHGIMPMCYPSDHKSTTDTFIVAWNMWMILELEDLLFRRGGDRAFVLSFRDKVYAFLDFVAQYENKDGLLEKLPSWVFIEWSKASELVQDINYPTNMLYARTMEAVARLFNDPALWKKGQALKETVRSVSFDGTFFVDNSVYDESGTAHLTGEHSETCQYYAFFTGVATPDTHPALWECLLNDFGPDREKTGLYPKVYPANACSGIMIRLCVLEEYGEWERLRTECKPYYQYMAEITGTLWEHVGHDASCNHGFASCVAHLLFCAEEQKGLPPLPRFL